MKKILVTAALGLLLAGSLQAVPLITVVEDSSTRLDFIINWGADLHWWDNAAATGPGGSTITFADGVNRNLSAWQVETHRKVEGVNVLTTAFFIRFAGPDQLFPQDISNGPIDLHSGLAPDFSYALPYGAEFIYGQDIPSNVPDGGSAFMLLAGALGTLAGANRSVKDKI